MIDRKAKIQSEIIDLVADASYDKLKFLNELAAFGCTKWSPQLDFVIYKQTNVVYGDIESFIALQIKKL